MHTKTWIIAALLLLGLTGGMVIWQKIERSAKVPSAAAVTAGKQKKKNKEMPIRTSLDPERMRPTRWTPLDDAGTNRRCNQDAMMQWQNETPCAASPANPDAVIVGANDFSSGNVVAGYYRTTDCGQSWQQSLYALGPSANGCSFAGDPSIAADASGRFYAVYCTYDCIANQGIYCQTSTNNGTTWGTPAPVGISGAALVDIDKPMAACDYSSGSPYLNNCYAVWMHIIDNTSIYFSRSTNGGVSFSTPVRISTYDGWCPSITVGPEGQVYSAWISSDEAAVYFNRSLNGGASWRTDVRVATYSGSVWPSNPCGAYRTTHYPAIASDISNSAYRGNVYLCWDMERGTDNGNIYFCRSTDNGVTWSDTVRINDDATNRMQWWSWIAVHPRTGDVGISWLDRRMDASNCMCAVYGTVSTDGGTTWAPNFQISDQILDPIDSQFLGDYTGTTFSSMGFMSSWSDPRNDECDAYAAWWNNGDQLTIQTPNGGEFWNYQQPCNVAWQYRYAPDTLAVELNRSYPTGSWERLAVVPSVQGSWTGTVTGPDADSARVRVIGLNLPTVGDTSDQFFRIGFAVSGVVSSRIGNDIRIGWYNVHTAYYRIYSSTVCCDSFTTLEGTTSDTVFMDRGAVAEPIKFYIVRASTEP